MPEPSQSKSPEAIIGILSVIDLIASIPAAVLALFFANGGDFGPPVDGTRDLGLQLFWIPALLAPVLLLLGPIIALFGKGRLKEHSRVLWVSLPALYAIVVWPAIALLLSVAFMFVR